MHEPVEEREPKAKQKGEERGGGVGGWQFNVGVVLLGRGDVAWGLPSITFAQGLTLAGPSHHLAGAWRE